MSSLEGDTKGNVALIRMQLRVILSVVGLFLTASCIMVVDADREDPAFVLGALLGRRTPSTETRHLNDSDIMFSNVGALLYPKPISKYIVVLLMHRETKGMWPVLPAKQIFDRFVCEASDEPPYLRLSITGESGKSFQVFLDKDLMVSVQSGQEEPAKQFAAVIGKLGVSR